MSNEEALKVNLVSDTEVAIIRVFDAPASLVFDAWTKPALITRWMIGPEGWTMPVCEVDLRVGGKWNFTWRKASGAEMAMHGEYREVTPPSRLVSTENWGGPYPETVNTLTLVERDGKTTATVAILYPSQAARDAAVKTGMVKGMEMSYQRLETVMQTLRQAR